MLLGSKDEKQETEEGTIEHWACSKNNPIGGWYGFKKDFRGRFAMYGPPLMEHLGFAEVEHHAKNNRIRYRGKQADNSRCSGRRRAPRHRVLRITIRRIGRIG